MTPALDELEVSLADLQRRIADACVSDDRPLCLHWSDAELLGETMRALRDQQTRIRHTANALTLAISLVK